MNDNLESKLVTQPEDMKLNPTGAIKREFLTLKEFKKKYMSDLKQEAKKYTKEHGLINSDASTKAIWEVGFWEGFNFAKDKAEAEAEMFYMKRMDKAVLEERQERDTHWKNELRNRYQKGVEAETKRCAKVARKQAKIHSKLKNEIVGDNSYHVWREEEAELIAEAIES